MSRRLTILAGGGALVPEVLGAAKASGDEIQVLPLVDRSDLGFSEVFGAADLPRLIWRITSFRTTHITMIGGLRATTGDRENFKRFAGSKSGLNGDSTLLTIAEKILAVTGAKVVGAEAIAPAILAQDGLIAGPPVGRPTLALARFALEKARAVGALDIGQAVVAAPGRILAVEDFAGTDALIERIGYYRQQGFESTAGLVLAKALKPQQSHLVDRPAIGPDTVAHAAAAGIMAVAVEANGAIIVDRAGLEARAGEVGVSVVGVRLDG
jgi:DUF1009 family protein